ncbi:MULTISPECIES: tyrosine--tRNA ligase [Isoptericola]|uniref:Tyrosine--tRNA ligase n=1 Tax=Isoptericola sediminis TaxID=2733572 RepID=A0A849K6R8_9MICO|nr:MULTISPECIES: tyrosine--tRNA ligase [unclassified Isoptericola]MDO8144723.1 tyrosine--tRNA ligase [Isoptericola sp. 178]MDO8152048.1 tyrosine--tRNA ligase [Isoptericola sp. b408]NNU28140.1 tyrosine--tRNA ligase [Isoptericola sediminis]
MTDVLDELHWRGLVAQSTDEAALREALSKGPVTYYCGFDPTAPSLHHGHLVQLILLRHLQLAGHRAIALVGGATGMIGDPRESGERVLNTKETVAEWTEKIRAQVSRFLDLTGDNPARVVNNLDWTSGLSAIDFLRDVGKHYRLGTMLAKDTVARRLRSDEGLSFTEFSYQILQGIDFRELYRRYDCTLQTGGNDQWGNLLSGVELIRRTEGVAVHAMTTPLITKADGTKFGKTEGGAVWLDPELMSPYAFYQFWLNQSDADVVRFLKIFTFRSRAEIEELEREVAERPFARVAQRTLANDVTTLVHGQEATDAVIAASQALFGRGELTELDAGTLGAATAELPRAVVRPGASVLDAFVDSGLVPSKAAGRRAIADGGAYVNNVKVSDDEDVLAAERLLHGRYAVLRRGKKTLAVAVVD